jgi:hypothetical protein
MDDGPERQAMLLWLGALSPCHMQVAAMEVCASSLKLLFQCELAAKSSSSSSSSSSSLSGTQARTQLWVHSRLLQLQWCCLKQRL